MLGRKHGRDLCGLCVLCLSLPGARRSAACHVVLSALLSVLCFYVHEGKMVHFSFRSMVRLLPVSTPRTWGGLDRPGER